MPPLHPPAQAVPNYLPRIVCYCQTYHRENGDYVSILPLLWKSTGVTHVIVAAIHLNDPPGNITLNDDPPRAPKFASLWREVRTLQEGGIKVLGMLGGAARGSFERLDKSVDEFEWYYIPLRNMIRNYGLNGLDLDVEEEMSLTGVIRLIDRLKADFGDEFLITLAPVATALVEGRRHLSGFSYRALEAQLGNKISWYNTQFYCGWGWMHSTAAYDEIVSNGWLPKKVVVGLLTNPTNAASGYLPFELVGAVLALLIEKYPSFGGVMAWEYFNSLPGDIHKPWEWAASMSLSMGMKRVRDAMTMLMLAQISRGLGNLQNV